MYVLISIIFPRTSPVHRHAIAAIPSFVCTQINLARLAEERAAVVRVDGADAAPRQPLSIVVVGLRLEERVHALDGLRAQRREEARHVLLVLLLLAG